MKLKRLFDNCGSDLKSSSAGPVYFQGTALVWGDRKLVANGPIKRVFVTGSYCIFSCKDDLVMKAATLDRSKLSQLESDRSFSPWPFYTVEREQFLFTTFGNSYKHGAFVKEQIFEYSTATQINRQIGENFDWFVSVSKEGRHYGHKGHGVPCIGQMDHDLNVQWEIDEPTLRGYGKVDKDDPRAEVFTKDCKVGNIQVFDDTLYYIYNFSMIIALDAHTGQFKRRFSRFPADHHSTYINPLNGSEGSLLRDIDALHAGRYIEELHAFVIVRQEHLIEIDYETLTARARPLPVHHLWKNSMPITDPVVTMIGKERIAVHAQFSKDVAILDYHTLEVLDFLRLDEEDPGGYLRGSLYHDGKLYVLSTAPSSAVKGCTLYEVEVDG